MSFAKQDELAQALSLDGLHPAFREGIHVRCLVGSAHDLRAGVFEGAAELLREQAVVVEDQNFLSRRRPST